MDGRNGTARSKTPRPDRLLLTPEEAAQVLSISRTRLYSLLARRVIRSIKEGRARLVPMHELELYVQHRLDEQCSPRS